MKSHSEIDRLMAAVTKAASCLEPETYDLVIAFVRQSQSRSGAFVNRGGQEDWYYSFFGLLISQAFNLHSELFQLRKFVFQKNRPGKTMSQVDWILSVLLRYHFKNSFFYKLRLSVILFFRWVFKRNMIDKVYMSFVTMVTLNHFWGWPRYLNALIGKAIPTNFVNDESPTSHLAAALIINHLAGLNKEAVIHLLFKKYQADGGFSTFFGQKSSDMLSTAVAFYALSRANVDISRLASEAFNYVSIHFDNGAFTAGDGDITRDVEYTFYGLLALGILAQSLTDNQL